MRHRRCLAATLALVLPLAAPASALADPAPTAAATEQARSHYKQGKAYQEAGDYDKAIAEYLEADRLASRPELLFNIAQCHRLAGHAEAAITYYRRFVEAMPGAAGADDARTYIAQLEKQVEAERAQAAARAKARQKRPPVVSVPRTQDAPRESHAGLRWLGAGSALAGVAIVGVGAYFGARAADEGDTLGATHGIWTTDLDEREAAAKRDEQRMFVLVGGGSVLLLGGAALWWWAGRSNVEAVPSVSHDRAGIVLRGRF